MHITSELAKGSFAVKNDSEAEKKRMKADHEGVMKLLAKAQEAMAEGR